MKHFIKRGWLFLALVMPVFAQTPPSFPVNILGQRQVNWNYTGLRPISPVPAVGVHPRVFVGPADRADVCNRLTNSWSGLELFTNYIQRYTAILRLGRSAGYDYLPTSIKTMPDGTARIGNVGFYDQSFYYTNLVAGQTNNIASLITNVNGGTFARTLAGTMALEALECWVLQGQTGVNQRATNLAVALDTWATYVLSRTDYTNANNRWMIGGGGAFAEVYDFNAWAMTPAQAARVRTAIARVMYAAPYQGVGVPPEADTSNWVSLDGFNLIMAMALEGETSVAVEGFSTNYFNAYFINAMGSFYDFITYGWHPSGEPFEGMGKGWFGGARHIAFAKRGYNFFGHPHLQNFVKTIWPACLQPFGFSWTHYDLIGGEGTDNLRGGRLYTASDQIAMQWVYTNLPAANFLWRNFVTTAWTSNSPATGTNNYKTFLDFRDSKFAVSSMYLQDLVEVALFVQDPATNDWNAQSALVRPNLDMVDTHGSTIVSRSGTDSNSVSFQFHTRQDFGGHTYAERGGFAVSGLGRVWVWFPYALNYGQDPGFSSQVLVDDIASYVTPQEGNKMRIPAKLAGWSTNPSALFATCDSTYSYTWQWIWNNYPAGSSVTLNGGYQPETNCFNNFRRSGNLIPENYGYTPFVNYPHWDNPGWFEGIQRAPFNFMQQVIRTAGLVRGAKPYVFVADDIQKDNASHVYKWLLQIPKDLTLRTGGTLPAGFNPATDCVLPEPATNGNRSLLVRILSPTNWLAFTETVSNLAQNSEQFYRLTVVSTNIAPAFKVMIYPFAAGDPIPTNTWTATNIFTVAIGAQTDTFTFSPRSVTTADGRSVNLGEFQITRSGTNIVDYRNQIEPFASTLASGGSPPAAPASLNAVGGNYSAVLTWPAVAGATGYNVKRAFVSGGPYTNVLTQTTLTNITDVTVFNGQNYFYVVTAVNGAGESAPSPEAAVAVGPGIAHSAASLVWAGDSVWNVWDNQNTNNNLWLNAGNPTQFWNGDSVSFTDAGSATPAVSLMQPLAPGGVVSVNSSNNYSLSGPGKLTGAMSLQKSGSGTLTVGMANDYTGGTVITGGTVSITTPSAWGTNVISFAGAGTLQWNGITTDLSSQLRLESGGIAGVDTMANVVTFTTPFLLGAPGGSFLKLGSGGLNLNATNGHTGGTIIAGGYLVITNSTSLGTTNAPLTISNGATLKIAGYNLTMTRPVTFGPGGAVFHPSQNKTLALNGPISGSGGMTIIWDAFGLSLGSSSNTYSGDTVIGGSDSLGGFTSAVLSLTADNALPFGGGRGNVVFTAGSGKQSILDLNGRNAQVNGLVSGLNASAIVDNRTANATNILTVGNGGTNSTFGGVITDTFGVLSLTKTGAGVFTLTGTNSYAGGTFVNAGRLALTGGGSIATSPLIAIAGGAVLDVSGLTSTFALGATQTLSNSAVGTGVINGNFNATAGTNSFIYTSGTPALLVTNGTFTLGAGSVLRVNNSGSALTAGSYKLIARATTGNAGTVNGVVSANWSITGGGVAAGTASSLQINGGELFLVVTNLTPPTLGGITLNGTNLVFTGTNGMAGANYLVLAATNLALQVSNWTVLSTNQFGPGGAVNFTNPLDPTAPQLFYRLRLP